MKKYVLNFLCITSGMHVFASLPPKAEAPNKPSELTDEMYVNYRCNRMSHSPSSSPIASSSVSRWLALSAASNQQQKSSTIPQTSNTAS